MNNYKQDISIFLDSLYQKYGYLPKFAHSNKEFDGQVLYAGFNWGKEELQAGLESLLFENWSINGPSTWEFESKYAKLVGNRASVFTNSGSSANLAAVASVKKVLGFKDGSTVLTAACAFPTTVNVIPQNNLKPIFVDIDFDETLNINLDELERKIQPDSVAVMVAPCLGNPMDYERLESICKKYNLVIINDLCDAIGGEYNDKPLTSYGIVNTCSLFSSHHFSVINGGLISMDNEDIERECRQTIAWKKLCYCRGVFNTTKNGECKNRFSNWIPERPELIVDHRYTFGGSDGYNLLNLSMLAAIGIQQLNKWDEVHLKRKNNKDRIQKLFQQYIKNIDFPKILPKSNPSPFGVGVICKDNNQRTKLVQHLENNKVQTRSYFSGNILAQPNYQKFGNWRDFPNSNKVLERIFFVGCPPFYREEHFNKIEETLKSFKNE